VRNMEAVVDTVTEIDAPRGMVDVAGVGRVVLAGVPARETVEETEVAVMDAILKE
jgi:hypothetical protein